MAGVPLPKPVSVAQFVPDTTAPTFTQIFHDTVGNLGTPTDGFDDLLGQMTALTNAAALIGDLDPADLQALSDLGAALGGLDAGPLALSLQPARNAVDAAYSDYTTIVPPPADPTAPITPVNGNPTQKPPRVCGGLTIGQPDPNGYPPVPGQRFFDYANVMAIGDPPQNWVLATEYETYSGPLHDTIRLKTGDPTIFRAFADDSASQGVQLVRKLTVQITAARVGRFQCLAIWTDDAGNEVPEAVSVTIVQC